MTIQIKINTPSGENKLKINNVPTKTTFGRSLQYSIEDDAIFWRLEISSSLLHLNQNEPPTPITAEKALSDFSDSQGDTLLNKIQKFIDRHIKENLDIPPSEQFKDKRIYVGGNRDKIEIEIKEKENTKMNTIKTHYLDASAMVKLIIHEKGSMKLKNYTQTQSVFTTTFLCFAEALGVLKRKYLSKKEEHISLQEYNSAVYCLLGYMRKGEKIQIDDNTDLRDREVSDEVEKLVGKYQEMKMDVSDALQIYSLRKGMFKFTTGESKPILITADRKLADAARQEDLKVWNCEMEDIPK